VRRSAQAAAIAAFFALVVVGILTGGDERDITATSFGTIGVGHGAVYDVLRELGFPVARSFVPAAELPAGGTVWWILPHGGCTAESFTAPAFTDWLESGGTAVVFLGEADSQCAADAELAGRALPARTGYVQEVAPDAARAEREAKALADVFDPRADETPEPVPSEIAGEIVRAPRRIALEPVITFVRESEWSEAAASGSGDPWRVVALRDGVPFALDRRVGAGRLVVLADGRFLENRALDRQDAALLAVDITLAFGPPRIDERAHGLVPSRDALGYLAGSPAAGAFAGLFLAALAFAWYGAAEPPRRVAELDTDAPTLESYVASLAGLYGATRDHARVLERYRELTARRLRRRLGLAHDTPLRALLDRLERRRRLPREGIAELRSAEPARTAAELARRAADLDHLVEEASR
jgi:hypothetical protein